MDDVPNAEHLEILRRGTDVWNRWRDENPHIVPDLVGAELVQADLVAARLNAANLYRARLGGANLESADLSKADLHEANVVRACLRNANLSGADLRATNLRGADLEGTDVTAAQLRETIFADADLSNTIGLESCIHTGPSILDYRTFRKSKLLPIVFLRECGLPEWVIHHLSSLLTEATQFYSCFISYSHGDGLFARRLHDRLQSRGVRCWLDQRALLPGDDIYTHVDEAIRLSEKVLLCCSEAALTSWWVDNEVGTALEKEQQLMRKRGAKVHVLIPLNLDGYIFSDKWKSGFGAEIRRRLAADFTGWKDDEAQFNKELERLIQALRADEVQKE